MGSLKLSEHAVHLIRSGSPVYLDDAHFEALVRRDELGARLWAFLEAEHLTGKLWRYSIFAAPPGETAVPRDTPAIAELLRIDHWQDRSDIVRRVKDAAKALCQVDGCYTVTVERAAHGEGMWNLCVRRGVRTVSKGGAIAHAGGCGESDRGVRTVRQDSENPCKSGTNPEVPSVLPSVLPSGIPSETATAAPPSLSQDFWSTYPRTDDSHKDRALRAFGKLTPEEQGAALTAAMYVRDAVNAGNLPMRYAWLPENFIGRDTWRDWQDGPPAAYRSDKDRIAHAVAGVFGGSVCSVCDAALIEDADDKECCPKCGPGHWVSQCYGPSIFRPYGEEEAIKRAHRPDDD